MSTSVHYCNVMAQGPFYNVEFCAGGVWNNIGPYHQLDTAIDNAKRRLIGMRYMKWVEVRQVVQNEKGFETVANVRKHE